ncbi:LlaJI family restriction endonuclease [Anaerococcus sp.]|uniref:LlaJI family restriction endonuclease n=1 Tax=Anaerococcus sp. TaxID=1872515 RepID=UPI00280C1C18|nr:LlaJI family restriction endonuclease [Anaerococcus sp.]MDU3176667.1 LlaJI family restriction endonuclease [Anaerococcus sp.]
MQNTEPNNSLFNYCRNASNIEGDEFVGIKSYSVDDMQEIRIVFPMGYRLLDDDDQIRNSVLELVSVLEAYRDEQSRIPQSDSIENNNMNRFPIKSYMTVIDQYLNNGYYQIREQQFARGTSGNINWSRTIKHESNSVIPSKNGFIYPIYRIKKHSQSDKHLITEINKYCVYVSFLKIGWLYNLNPPQKHDNYFSLDIYKQYLKDYILQTNVDNDKILFQAMLDILNYENPNNPPEDFYYGTNNFEFIWENLVQDTYGNVDKSYYFPRTKWILKDNKEKTKPPLQPDTIMKFANNVFVLDAKYYKYGISKNEKDLPNSSSINKQISYGEFIVTNPKFQSEIDNGLNVYNAFLMPYNSEDELYHNSSDSDDYYSIGEAISDWKDGSQYYHRVQGILVDVNRLMKNNIRPSDKEIIKLSDAIKKSIKENEELKDRNGNND